MSIRTRVGKNRRDFCQQRHGGSRNQKEQGWEGFFNFGNGTGTKNASDIRIASWNLNTFPTTGNKDKYDTMIKHLTGNQYDVIAVNETNINWSKMPREEHPQYRLKGVWESVKANFYYNKNDVSIDRIQPGGTGIISNNKMANRYFESGSDPLGLGRWTWVKYRGKNKHELVVVSAYRPCTVKDDKGNARRATFRQHKDLFAQLNRLDDPREGILSDLKIQLKEWLDNGMHVVVTMDTNEDIRLPVIEQFFQKLGMKEAILHRHPHQRPVATRFPGTKPIDGIWVSKGLTVVQSGYTAFEETQGFDHRAAWIDVSISEALGHHIPPIVTYAARRLKLNDPTIVAKYNELLEQHLVKHKVAEKLQILRQTFNQHNELSAAQIISLEKLDTLVNEGMVYAESRCRKLKVGEVEYSEKYRQLTNLCRFWEGVFRVKVMKRPMNDEQLLMRAKEANILKTDFESLTLEDIKFKRREAKRLKMAFKPHSKSERFTYLGVLAERRAKEKNSTAEKEIRQLQQTEKQREVHRRLKYISKKINNGSVTMIEETSEEGEIITITNKDEIETKCQESCKRRLNQSRDTPFNSLPWREIFPSFQQNNALTQLCNGSFAMPETADKYTKELMAYLPKNIPSINNTWTLEEYRSGWRIKRERTSSGDSPTHVGHYKAGVQVDHIANIHLELMNLASLTGHSFKRWRRSLDVMIPKKVNSFQADKLRLINLMEPDFNFFNGMVSRRFMKELERKNLAAKEQYGSRKGHSAIAHAINKVLTMDYLRISKTSAIICANDAKSNYDRIVLRAAFITLRSMGLPASTIAAMFDTIQKMKHYTRTAFGTSDSYYGGEEWEESPDGVLQGNAFGPGIWVGVSTPILNMMRGQNYGIKFTQVLTGLVTHICGFAFVDDADLAQAAEKEESRDDLLKKAQSAISQWEGGIFSTGGAIVPEKSDWVLIDFKWRGTKWSYTKMDPTEKLTVLNCERIDQPLQQLTHKQGRLTLGVHIAPDGNWKDEKLAIRSKAQEWAANIREGMIQRSDAWIGLNTHIYKSLGYSLPATYLSRKELNEAWAPAISQGIAASGVVRNLDRSIVYGDTMYQGLGLRHPYILQGIEHIKIILTHGVSQSLTGILLRTNIEASKQELGLGGSFFTQNYDQFEGLVTKSWVKSTWQFLWEHKLALHEDTEQLQLASPRDSFLVQDFKHIGKIDAGRMKVVNRCRLYLEITTLAEILNSSGQNVRYDILHGMKNPHTVSKQSFHTTGKPTAKEWEVWKTALFDTYGFHQGRTRLTREVGDWIDKGRRWKWYYDQTGDRVYEIVDAELLEIKVYTRFITSSRRSSRRARYKLSTPSTTLPNSCIRASIHFASPNTSILTLDDTNVNTDTHQGQRDNETIVGSTAPMVHNVKACFHTLPQNKRWSVNNTLLPNDNCHQLVESIKNQSAIAMSDGSFKDSYGTTGFIITGDDISSSVIGVAPCLGRREYHDAYRAELTGVLAMLIILETLCKSHSIEDGLVTLSCDNDTALERCLDEDWEVKISDKNWDIIRSARTIRTELPIKIKMAKVSGHADKVKQYSELSRLEKLNFECDKLAGIFREQTYNHQAVADQILPFQGWTISIANQLIINNLEDTLHQHCSKDPILQTWQDKRDLDRETATLVDWDSMSNAMKLVPISRRIFVVKHVADRAATGVEMMKRKERDFDHCPRCKQPHENSTHVIICPAKSASQQWDVTMMNLEQSLQKLHCPSDFPTALIAHLTAWRTNNTYPDNSSYTPHTKAMIQAQHDIGWGHALDGCIHKQWREEIALFHKNNYSNKVSHKRWTTAIIRKMWDVSWDMWDQRNAILFQVTPDEDLLGITKMKHTIRRELDQGRDVLMSPDERALFSVDIDEVQEWTLDRMNTWYSRVVAARQLSAARNEIHMTSERRGMARWLNSSRNK